VKEAEIRIHFREYDEPDAGFGTSFASFSQGANNLSIDLQWQYDRTYNHPFLRWQDYKAD
jgi:hypothetical protein